MDAPIYEDDLTTIDARHISPLLRLRHRAAAAVVALGNATDEDKLHAAVAELADVEAVVNGMFFDDEIRDPDMPFGEVRLEWVGVGPKGNGSAEGDDDDAEGNIEDDGDVVSDNSSIYSESEDDDGEEDADMGCQSLMEMAAKCNGTSFPELRRLHALSYTIHLCRIDRLILRLPPSHPLPPTHPAFEHVPPLLSPYNHDSAVRGCKSLGRAGAQLSDEAEAEYAKVLADEIACVAEYKQAVVRVLMREIAGCGE